MVRNHQNRYLILNGKVQEVLEKTLHRRRKGQQQKTFYMTLYDIVYGTSHYNQKDYHKNILYTRYIETIITKLYTRYIEIVIIKLDII